MSALIIHSEIVHYEVLGRGRPLIFVHGWVGSWRYWIPSMQATSVSFRAYALDLWGFGDTSKAKTRYSIDAQADLLYHFLDEMGIGKIALVGHGLGAIVSILLAHKNPEMVDRIMAVGFPFSVDQLSSRLNSVPPAELGDWLLGNTPGSDAARTEASKADVDAITNSLASIQETNLLSLATDLTIPCLLVHGQNDLAVTPPVRNDLDGFAENIHQVVFEESGHYPMISEPNKFNRLLTDFLNLNSHESLQSLQIKEEWKRRVR